MRVQKVSIWRIYSCFRESPSPIGFEFTIFPRRMKSGHDGWILKVEERRHDYLSKTFGNPRWPEYRHFLLKRAPKARISEQSVIGQLVPFIAVAIVLEANYVLLALVLQDSGFIDDAEDELQVGQLLGDGLYMAKASLVGHFVSAVGRGDFVILDDDMAGEVLAFVLGQFDHLLSDSFAKGFELCFYVVPVGWVQVAGQAGLLQNQGTYHQFNYHHHFLITIQNMQVWQIAPSTAYYLTLQAVIN